MMADLGSDIMVSYELDIAAAIFASLVLSSRSGQTPND